MHPRHAHAPLFGRPRWLTCRGLHGGHRRLVSTARSVGHRVVGAPLDLERLSRLARLLNRVERDDGVRLAYQEECQGDEFQFTVVSRFRRDRSWVRAALFETPARAARLLDHEQEHFDLSEVHARGLRQWLTSLKNPCGMKKDDRHSLITRHVRDDARMQGRYDRDTNFGRDSRAQAGWSAKTSRSLKQLAPWAVR